MRRLNSSSDLVDISKLSNEFVDTVYDVFKDSIEEEEILTVMFTYSHMFCGLNVNDIRKRLPLMEQKNIKYPCREYIRKKLVTMMKRIEKKYIVNHGHKKISPLFKENNIDLSKSFPIKLEDIDIEKEETKA